MKLIPNLKLCGIISIALAHASTTDAAFLEGNTMEVGRIHGSSPAEIDAIVSANVVVGPGVELTDFGAHEPVGLQGLFDIDISDSRILIRASRDQQVAGLDSLSFLDIFHTIFPFSGVVVEPETNWAGFAPVRAHAFSEQVTVRADF